MNEDRADDTSPVRARLLAAAAAVIAERGIAAARLDDIAARAGYTKGAIYSQFDSKDDLILHLLETQLAQQLTLTASWLEHSTHIPDLAAILTRDYGANPAERRARWVLAAELRLYTERNPDARARYITLRHNSHIHLTDLIDRYLTAHPEAPVAVALTASDLAHLVDAITIGLGFDLDIPGTPTPGTLIAQTIQALAPTTDPPMPPTPLPKHRYPKRKSHAD